MKSIKKVKQHDITDCGAACLASVLSYYGLKFPISKIRQYASTDQKGTNVLGMIEAANKLGLQAKGVKGEFDSLYKIPLPSIAHIVVKDTLHHFIVIYKVTKEYILIMDPATGDLLKKTHEDFKKEWTGILILMLPTEKFEKGNKKKSIISRFITLIKPHKSIMLQALVGAIFYSILGLSTSIYIGKITDYVLVDGNIRLLHLMSVIMIALLIIKIYIGSVKSFYAIKTGQKIDATLILGYYKHLMKLPQQFFDTMRIGEVISRISDAVKIRNFINDVAIDLVVNVFIAFFTFALMFIYSWKLALVMLISVPLFVFIYFIYNKINKKYLRTIMEDSAELESQLVESLNAMSTVKRFGLEEFSNSKTESKFLKLLYSTFSSVKYSLFTGNFSAFISGAITIIILWVGAYNVVQKELTPGELMSFYALIGYVLSPISSLISANQSIQNALIAADRLFQIMDLDREESNDKKMELTKDMIGSISFRNVKFRYGSRVQVFNDFNLEIEKNKTTAIVGESGSGKTTLISLFQSIYPLQSGSISIGNIDLKYISKSSLRKLVSVVPQNIDLFSGTVIENIAIGDSDLDMKLILSICEKLNIMEFIEKLPNGFNTYIGENGTSLSGGERQRLAIARALYKKPEILILDEATSSLDSASEEYVQNTINYIKSQNKTIIIIAHRLSTIMNADSIVLIKKGKVIEKGNHTELYEMQAEYYALWQKQFPKALKHIVNPL